uniref:Uncharacterized protein n=1 Tax=Oryza rufipogon TaxID=4529 RepID=A0A0E0N053_ORYRU
MGLLLPYCTAKEVIRVPGAFLSILLYASPFVVYWSSGSNYDVIRSFYTKFDLLSIALSIISWLMFSLCQRHGVDGKTVGWAPIIVYSIGLVLYCVLLVMRFCPDGTICHTTIALLLGITLLLLLFDMFEPIKREQKTAKVLSGLAALMQLTSEALPYAGMRALCCADPAPAPVIVDLPQASSQAPVVVDPPQAPAQAPVIKNRRKLTIFVRAVDAGVTLFWAVYCAYNYDHICQRYICGLVLGERLRLHILGAKACGRAPGARGGCRAVDSKVSSFAT